MESGKNKINERMAGIQDSIKDSVVQLMCFKMEGIRLGIDEIKKIISETELKTLQEYTGRTTEELNAVQPGICEKYNLLIKDIKDPNLNVGRFVQIMEEAWSIAHSKK